MDHSTQQPGPFAMRRAEFVALVAMMFATVAFSLDAMLPAFPQMAADLAAEGKVHLILTAFMAGLGLGTLIAGPLSDTLGRKPVLYLGYALYAVGAVMAWQSAQFEIVLAARFLQGLGTAGPRVVSLAVVRDLYAGRDMAQITSFAMTLFTAVPVIAPMLGAWITAGFGWRAIFASFLVFALIATIWIALRLPESLVPEKRRDFRPRRLWAAAGEVLSHPVTRRAIGAQSMALALIFVLIVMIQPIYDVVFGRADSFPYWFGAIALFSAAGSSLTNAMLVQRMGMRRLAVFGLGGQIVAVLALIAVAQMVPGALLFPAFVVWQFLLIAMTGFTVGNLNAIALEPMGHIAGMASSVAGALATLVAALIASGVGRLFDGTVMPLAISVLVIAATGLAILRGVPRETARPVV